MTAAPLRPLDSRGLETRRSPSRIPNFPHDVSGMLARAVAAHPDREAVVGRFARYTYRELDTAVGLAASALQAAGLAPGQRVAGCLPNHPDIVIAFLAVLRCGGIWTGINPVLSPPEKAFILHDAEVSMLLADVSADVNDWVPSADLLRIPVDPARPGEWARHLSNGHTGGYRKVEVDPFGPAAIAYTTGTTGQPKGVVHSQHNLVVVGAANAGLGMWRSQRRQGVVLSMSILNVMTLGPLLVFALGGTCVCVDSARPGPLAQWIEQEQIESFSTVPTILYDLLADPAVADEQLRSLTHLGVGGSSCPEPLRVAYKERLGGELLAGYGMTEAPTVITCQSPDRPVLPAASGRAIPHLDVHVLDPSGGPLPVGEVGEVCVRAVETGPWSGVYTPFLGYWKRPEATRAALEGGVLHTGDLGYLDADGELWLTGRMSDVIVRGGANVYPAEIEGVLNAAVGVAAAAVVGVPDARLGEQVVAFVEAEPGARLDEDGLRRRCASELARYKVPDRVVIARLPRNAMGKVVKTKLVDELGQ